MAPNRKSVLITGCSAGGIGDALAQAFHGAGLRVFATARNLSKVQHLKDMGMDVLALDVVDDTSVKSAVEEVRTATGGKLDFLVNNSGIGYSMPLLDSDPAEIKKMLDVNIVAVITTTQAFAPLLIASKGMIINIGSIAGVSPFPWQSGYNASKAGVNILTDTMRIELEPLGVKVVLVITGAIATNFFQSHTNLRLPPTSVYLPAKEKLETLISGKGFEARQVPAKSYADQVVKNVLKSSPKQRLWLGGSANTIWFGATFLWATAWDMIFADEFGVAEVKKRLQEKRTAAKQ